MTGKAKEWDVPLFLGEFGAPAGANRGLEYVDMLYRRLDDGFHSGAHCAPVHERHCWPRQGDGHGRAWAQRTG